MKLQQLMHVYPLQKPSVPDNKTKLPKEWKQELNAAKEAVDAGAIPLEDYMVINMCHIFIQNITGQRVGWSDTFLRVLFLFMCTVCESFPLCLHLHGVFILFLLSLCCFAVSSSLLVSVCVCFPPLCLCLLPTVAFSALFHLRLFRLVLSPLLSFIRNYLSLPRPQRITC